MNKRDYEALKKLLADDPILWAVVRGASSIGTIVQATLYGPKEVEAWLEELEKEGEIVKLDGRWLPDEQYDDLEVTAKEIWAKGKAISQARANELTERQRTTLEKIRVAHGKEPFTTREAALANGYDRSGFMANVLVALEKKEKIRQLKGRPKRWMILSD